MYERINPNFIRSKICKNDYAILHLKIQIHPEEKKKKKNIKLHCICLNKTRFEEWKWFQNLLNVEGRM